MSVRTIFHVFGLSILFEMAALSSHARDVSKKAPIPDDVAQAQALKLVKEVYGDELAAAKTAEQKKALAKKLLAKAEDTPDDPAGEYALLKASKSVALQANDAETALEALDKMADVFAVDALEMKLDVLNTLSAKAHSSTEHEAIAGLALGLQDRATVGEKFDVAQKLGRLALDEARKARDAQLVRKAQGQITDIQQMAKVYEEAKSALVTLEKTPDDPQANLTVGKYNCFVKGNWEKGIPMLSLAKDAEFSGLAQKDLVGATSSTEQTKLADGWWNIANKQSGTAKSQLQRRAAYWYHKALPGLSGLEKELVEKRLAETNEEPKSATDPAQAPRKTPVRRLSVRIVSAQWGGGNHWADVTKRVKELVAEGSDIWASTDCLKADPTPGWKKKLKVTYVKAGKHPNANPDKPLTPAARRALEEAAARHAAEVQAPKPEEFGGPKGPEPTRFGDWERKGIAVDF